MRRQEAGARRIKSHADVFRQHDESNHGETGERADHQCQNQKYLLLAFPQQRQAMEQWGPPPRFACLNLEHVATSSL